ncbi:DUF3267 domain-containing protein [Spirosoma flavum]|uniref:DUF3267 domain-containing protein n=1 Tax=Spirosoma flavum TaxID=2048557 RepID=A0ABW6AHA6_9BACT
MKIHDQVKTKDMTLSTFKAQLYGGVAFLVGIPLMVWPFASIWPVSLNTLTDQSNASVGLLWFMVAMFAGILLHELIHGLTAKWIGRLSWRTIKFGVQWSTITPYCHPTIPITARAYRLVVVMPLIITGLLPYGFALATGSGWLCALGILFTLAAAGDMMILWLMRHLRPNDLVQDHPTKVGLLVVLPISTTQ